MKVVSQNFMDALYGLNPNWSRQVYYKRRYWNETTKTYVWESAWTLLPESAVQSISQISAELDAERLNEYRVSGVTIVADDNLHEWSERNSAGFFAPDAGSIFGYEPYLMKFQIRLGLEVLGGVTEYVTLYTGLATDFIQNTIDKTVQIGLSGLEILLVKSDAERVSTRVVNEVIGTGDDVETVFVLDNAAVALVEEVSINGIEQRIGQDVTVDGVGDPDAPATITFAEAPIGSTTLRCTYTYWHTNQDISDLVRDLLEVAGIDEADQEVNPAIFPNAVISSWDQTTRADFEAGTGQFEYTSVPGQMRPDYGHANAQTLLDAFASLSPDWIPERGRFTISAGALKYSHTSGASNPHEDLIYRTSNKVCGRWQVTLTNLLTGASQGFSFRFYLTANVVNGSGSGLAAMSSGYVVDVTESNGSNNSSITLYRVGSSPPTIQLGSSYVFTRDTSAHELRITRNALGEFTVYWDGVAVITGTDVTYTTSTYTGFYVDTSGVSTNIDICTMDNLYTPTGTYVAVYESAEHDFGSAPTSWAGLMVTRQLGGATLVNYTNVSADGITYDGYVEATGTVIGSALKRWVQVKFAVTLDQTQLQEFFISEFEVLAAASQVLIRMADFSGMTAYDAIVALAALPNFEFGFTSEGIFFFRSKATESDSVLDMDQDDFILAIPNMSGGYDRVFHSIRASYGAFQKDVNANSDSRGSPLTKYLRQRFELDGGGLLISDDVDIATGAANEFAKHYFKKRRKLKLYTKMLPHLELSDVVNISYADNRPSGWFVGDTSKSLGDTSLQLYGGSQQLVHEQDVKIVAVRFETDAKTCEIDVEEIVA